MRNRCLIALTFLLAACGDASSSADTGLFIVQSLELDALSASVDCRCFWDGYGYASQSACYADRAPVLTSSVEACVIEVGSDYPRFEPLVECRFLAATTRLNCYYLHDDTCNESGFDGCDDAYDASFANCLSEDPCGSLPTSERADCEVERGQLQANTSACSGS